ncbi:MAG: histidinol dehydrogenase [Alphaproteobacteria bacterium]|nr:histidinol dehydrogenase [Alphaproteobacteria bacterium]
MPLRLDSGEPAFAACFAALVAGRRGASANVEAEVAAIIADVAARGDAAVLDYTRRFDRFDLTADRLRVGAAEIATARAACAAPVLAALIFAAERIAAFHERQRPLAIDVIDSLGVRLGARWAPVPAVGLYVPGGRAAYPSSVLMNAVPARVAGVPRRVMVVPAPDGEINPYVLAAADLAGVHEIYRIGGAQAVAALAHGTATIAAVDKIVGPGNAYVAAAKRQVYGRVGIDAIAGPSEVVVVSDGRSDPTWIAADLMAQAEHDADAQAILITDDPALAEAVCGAVESLLGRMARGAIARASWQAHGAVIQIASLAEAPALVDALAPEHVQLMVEGPAALAERISHAGAIFLGRHTPEAIGDYVGGPNHVLPTSRTARFSSGLSVLDFMKRTTLLGCDPASLAALGPAAVALAEVEGLGAHALSVALRLPGGRGG